MTIAPPFATKLLAASAPEFHSVRPAAAFVAIVCQPQFLSRAAALISGHGFANLLPVQAGKRSLSVATATVRKLNSLQDRTDDAVPAPTRYLKPVELLAVSLKSRTLTRFPKIDGLLVMSALATISVSITAMLISLRTRSGAVCPQRWGHLREVVSANQRWFFAFGGLTHTFAISFPPPPQRRGKPKPCDSRANRRSAGFPKC